MTSEPLATPLTDAEFHALSGAVLAVVEATVDQWLQDDIVDIDSHRTGGLLELSFPNGSKLVLNTQPPLHELWLAARSGDKRPAPAALGNDRNKPGADAPGTYVTEP